VRVGAVISCRSRPIYYLRYPSLETSLWLRAAHIPAGIFANSNSTVDKKSVGKSSIFGRAERLLFDVRSIANRSRVSATGYFRPDIAFSSNRNIIGDFGWLESCRLQDWGFGF
jgi:hypothetical protein